MAWYMATGGGLIRAPATSLVMDSLTGTAPAKPGRTPADASRGHGPSTRSTSQPEAPPEAAKRGDRPPGPCGPGTGPYPQGPRAPRGPYPQGPRAPRGPYPQGPRAPRGPYPQGPRAPRGPYPQGPRAQEGPYPPRSRGLGPVIRPRGVKRRKNEFRVSAGTHLDVPDAETNHGA